MDFFLTKFFCDGKSKPRERIDEEGDTVSVFDFSFGQPVRVIGDPEVSFVTWRRRDRKGQDYYWLRREGENKPSRQWPSWLIEPAYSQSDLPMVGLGL